MSGIISIQGLGGSKSGLLGNLPSFSARSTSGHSGGNWSGSQDHGPIEFQTVEWDTHGSYSTSTWKFLPKIEGLYFLTAVVYVDQSWDTVRPIIYKNGTGVAKGSTNGSGAHLQESVTALLYANGTTDYFQIYVYTENTNNQGATAPQNCRFGGHYLGPGI